MSGYILLPLEVKLESCRDTLSTCPTCEDATKGGPKEDIILFSSLAVVKCKSQKPWQLDNAALAPNFPYLVCDVMSLSLYRNVVEACRQIAAR